MSKGIIGISTAETGRFSTFYASLSSLARPENVKIAWGISAVISDNRNYITNQALKAEADWILYLDDDHILLPDTLQKLLAADKDVISALYTQRQPPFRPVLMDKELPNGYFVYKHLDPKEKGIISVAAAGAGCLLVKTKVIKALQPPYWTLGQIHPTSWGDDLHFCSRVRKAGFEVHCDLDNPIGHIMTGIVWPTHHENNGWVAAYTKDVSQSAIAFWPMPLPGDP